MRLYVRLLIGAGGESRALELSLCARVHAREPERSLPSCQHMILHYAMQIALESEKRTASMSNGGGNSGTPGFVTLNDV